MEPQNKRVARINSDYMEQYDAYKHRQLKKKKRLYRRLALFTIIMVGISSWLISSHIKERQLYAEKQQKYEQLQKQMNTLKSKEKDLRQEVKLLNDDEYVLQIARADYFFSKDGEIIFTIPNEKPSY